MSRVGKNILYASLLFSKVQAAVVGITFSLLNFPLWQTTEDFSVELPMDTEADLAE